MFREFDYENKPVVDIVNEMILDAINKGASDIHFDPTEDDINVRIRIDGELLDYAKVPAFVKKNLLTRIKIISGMNITETRLPQDGAIKSVGDKTDFSTTSRSIDKQTPIVDITWAFWHSLYLQLIFLATKGTNTLDAPPPPNMVKFSRLILYCRIKGFITSIHLFIAVSNIFLHISSIFVFKKSASLEIASLEACLFPYE